MNMANGRGSRPSAVGGRKAGSSRGASGPGPVGTGSADATIHGPVADLLGVLPAESTSGARIGSTYRLKLFPPVRSHCTMLPSSAAETTDFPSGAMAMSSMVPRWPLRTCACCHLPPESRLVHHDALIGSPARQDVAAAVAHHHGRLADVCL